MKLTPEQFAKALPHARPSDRLRFLAPLNTALQRWDITEPMEVAHFLAQAAHESSSLRRLEENLNYSTTELIRQVFSAKRVGEDPWDLVHNPEALANRVYANRNGNGDEASGDGWRYRGRGIVQLTGRDNYAAYEAGSGHPSGYPATANPDLLTEPFWAADSFGWFWSVNDCGTWARADRLEAVSGIINRGSPHKTAAGLADRRLRLLEARKALGV